MTEKIFLALKTISKKVSILGSARKVQQTGANLSSKSPRASYPRTFSGSDWTPQADDYENFCDFNPVLANEWIIHNQFLGSVAWRPEFDASLIRKTQTNFFNKSF